MKALVALAFPMLMMSAAVAQAQHVECDVQGVLLVVAIDSPVTVCAFDVFPNNSNQLDPTVNITPQIKLGTPAP